MFSVKPVLAIIATTAESGDTVIFTCTSPGDPSPGSIVYKLYHNDSPASTSDYVESPDGTFTLSNSATSHDGAYKCTADVDSGGESDKSDPKDLAVVGMSPSNPFD